VTEKKIPVGPLPRATHGKDVAECLAAFAESFRPSAKPGFPVVFLFELPASTLEKVGGKKLLFKCSLSMKNVNYCGKQIQRYFNTNPTQWPLNSPMERSLVWYCSRDLTFGAFFFCKK
jgi:hypothetical protein